jgi:hypothetical protein
VLSSSDAYWFVTALAASSTATALALYDSSGLP